MNAAANLLTVLTEVPSTVTNDQLANRLGCSRRQVQRSLRKLTDAGLVRVTATVPDGLTQQRRIIIEEVSA